jgi:hypothetical protein
MIPKIYKPALIIAAMLAVFRPALAQNAADSTGNSGFDNQSFNKDMKVLDMKVNVDTKRLELAVDKLGRRLNGNFNDFDNNLHINNLAADITCSINDVVREAQ